MTTQTTPRSNTLLLSILVVLAILLLVPLLAMLFMMPMMGMMGGMDGAWMISPVWGLGMILLGLLVIVGIGYALYRAFTTERLTSSDTALEELRSAYARGELSQEEFKQRREDLR